MAEKPLRSAPRDVPWTDAMRWALGDAMNRHRHSQTDCAKRLSELEPQLDVSQTWVSDRMRLALTTDQGRLRRLSDLQVGAILVYLDEVGIEDLTQYEWSGERHEGADDHETDAAESGAEVDPGHAAVELLIPEVDKDEFVRAGEPELGGRRARLVDAALSRLDRAEGEFTEHEARAYRWLSLVLRIDPPFR